MGDLLLFRAAAAAVQQLAQDPRFVGGQIGMVGVLHTWGRNLAYHPYVYFLVPGGRVNDNDGFSIDMILSFWLYCTWNGVAVRG